MDQKRRPGRQPLDASDPSVPVNVSLPSRQLAKLSDMAKKERMTPQDWIRRMIRDGDSNKSG